MNEPELIRIRHPLRIRLVRVVDTIRLARRTVGVTVSGAQLAGFNSPGFDDHVKLFFPLASDEVPALPHVGLHGPSGSGADEPSIARDFTPRRFDAARQELTFEFALHDGGPASDWAAAAVPGKYLGIGGPRGSMLIPTSFDQHVLIGDETALPAIARRLEELPAAARASVIVEVERPEDELPLAPRVETSVTWVHRRGRAPGTALLAAVVEARLSDAGAFAWIACESSAAKAIRRHLVEDRHWSGKRIKASGYWRSGACATHDVHDV